MEYRESFPPEIRAMTFRPGVLGLGDSEVKVNGLDVEVEDIVWMRMVGEEKKKSPLVFDRLLR